MEKPPTRKSVYQSASLSGIPIEVRRNIYNGAAKTGKDYSSISSLNKEATKRAKEIDNVSCTNPPLSLLVRYAFKHPDTKLRILYDYMSTNITKKGQEVQTEKIGVVTFTYPKNGTSTIGDERFARQPFYVYLNDKNTNLLRDQLDLYLTDNGRKDTNVQIPYFPSPLLWYRLVRDKSSCNKAKVLAFIREFCIKIYLYNTGDAISRRKLDEDIEKIQTKEGRSGYRNPSQFEYKSIKAWFQFASRNFPHPYFFYILQNVETTDAYLDFIDLGFSESANIELFENIKNLNNNVPIGLTENEFKQFYINQGLDDESTNELWNKYLNNALVENGKYDNENDFNNLRGYPKSVVNNPDLELDKYYAKLGITNGTYIEYLKTKFYNLLDYDKKKNTRKRELDASVDTIPLGLTNSEVVRYIRENITTKVSEINALSTLYRTNNKMEGEENEETEETEETEEIEPKSPRTRLDLIVDTAASRQ